MKKRTKIIIVVAGLLIIGGGYFYFKSKGASQISYLTTAVARQDLSQTVSATGKMKDSEEVSLNFVASGKIQAVPVKVGDQVKAGQVLARLDQTSAAASLMSAQGTLASAKANYEKVLAGSTNEQVKVSQRAVDAAAVALNNAKSALTTTRAQQDTAVQNAHHALINSTMSAEPGSVNGSITATISGSYNSEVEGQYQIIIRSNNSGNPTFNYTGLETGSGSVDIGPQPLGTRGIYIQFSSKSVSSSDSWMVTIPNTLAAAYVANYNAYQAALRTRDSAVASAQAVVNSAEVSLEQAEANLALQQAQARPSDIDAAKAQILSAQGQVASAQAAFSNTILTAPMAGTITKINNSVGEFAAMGGGASGGVIAMVGDQKLEIELDVPESDIAKVKVGNTTSTTLDAFGSDVFFPGTVVMIDPAQTEISGVVYYKIKIDLAQTDKEIKPGMTANVDILTAHLDKALVIPQRAVVDKSGKKIVQVMLDPKINKIEDRQIETGLYGDDGLIEVISGLSEGEQVVTYIKNGS